MTSATRRTAVLGASFALASAGLLGTAVAGTHGGGHTGLKATTLTVHAPANTTSHGRLTVAGKLRSHHTALANESVSLQERSGKGAAWADSGQPAQTTGTDGKVSFTLTQGTSKEQYRLFFAGDSTYKKSHSGTVTVRKAAPAPTTTTSPSPAPTS
jgi:hypothetical protein